MNFGRFGKIASVSLIGAMLLAGCSGNGQTVMKIGDTNITEGAVNFFANYGMGTEDVDTAVDNLKQEYLLKEVAKAMDIKLDSDTQSKLKDYQKSIKDSYDREGGYKKFLKDNNLTDDYIDKLASVSYYTDALKKQTETPTFTEDELREYFKEHYRRVKYVLISTIDSQTGDEVSDDKKEEAKKTAEEVLEKAQNGEDFDTLISDYSPNTANDSDENGYIFTDNETGIEFEEGVDSIKADEFTLVQSDSGYYVIKRLPLDESQECFEEEYENEAETINTTMQNNAFYEQVQKWADEYGIKVTVNDEVLDKIN